MQFGQIYDILIERTSCDDIFIVWSSFPSIVLSNISGIHSVTKQGNRHVVGIDHRFDKSSVVRSVCDKYRSLDNEIVIRIKE